MDTVKSILKGDKYIWGVYLMLCMISIVEMYSATSTLTFKIQDYLAPTIRHTLILFCGTIGVIIIHNFHYKWFKLIPVVLLPLSFILLVYAMFFGEEVNGAQRWLTICGIPLQPSELAKMAVVITVSFILAKKQVPGGVQPDTFKTILIGAIRTGLFLPNADRTCRINKTIQVSSSTRRIRYRTVLHQSLYS